MFCSKCGIQSADENKFCPACGNSFAQIPAPQYAPVEKSNKNSFISKLKNDKLNLALFCTSVVLAIAVVTMAVIMITSGGDSQSIENTTESKPTGIQGVWAAQPYGENDDNTIYTYTFADGGSGKMSVITDEYTYDEDILWEISGNNLVVTRTAGDGYRFDEEFEYKIEGNYLYLDFLEDGVDPGVLPLRWISSDTSASDEVIKNIFNRVKDEYSEVFEQFMEEYYEDDEYYD